MKAFKLDDEPKIKPGFNIPDQYFEQFPAKFTAQLPANAPKVIPLHRKRKSMIFAAAAVLILALTIPLIHYFSTPAKLDEGMLENYLAVNAEISDEDIAELLEIDDLQKIKIDSDIESTAIEDLLSTNSNLEEYLVN